MSNEYTLIDLEEERQNSHKWILGPFQPKGSSEHSEVIEIGYVNLQEVERKDILHFHNNCEEYYIMLEGHMKIQVGESTVEVSKGQILRVQPQAPHLILEVQPDTRIVLVKVPPSPGDKTNVPQDREIKS